MNVMPGYLSQGAQRGGYRPLSVADKKRLLHEMLFARRFEERCYEAYVERKIGGFLHLYSGQEACAHGVMEVARPGHDYVITGYRDHIHAIKCGADPKAVMAELYGKETGVSRGRGGSMHIFDVACRFMGGYALVGGPFPLAVGIAKGIKMKGGDEISICFLGDAANNQGTFHESLNMAKLWELPVLFVCENNLYAMGVPLEDSEVETDIWRKARAYRMGAEQVDGMDPVQVEAAARRAVASIRAGQGPYFLEARTYRFRAHSMFDTQAYRTRGEIEGWKHLDPIERLRAWMVANHQLTDAEAAAIEAEVTAEIDAAVAFAEAGTLEPIGELERFVLMDAVVQEVA